MKIGEKREKKEDVILIRTFALEYKRVLIKLALRDEPM